MWWVFGRKSIHRQALHVDSGDKAAPGNLSRDPVLFSVYHLGTHIT